MVRKADSSLYDFMYKRTDSMIPLRKGLDAFALRQKVIASNLANAETPNYRAQRVSFEKELGKVLDRRTHNIARSNETHIPLRGGIDGLEKLQPRVYNDSSPRHINGVNNVDIDDEMGILATNQIHFSAAAKVLATRYRMLLTSIRGH
ncbi:flagellar basal body rod protein FlgB [bacterium]|nr:flagellar basal body rod protein FlgB [bacterium]